MVPAFIEPTPDKKQNHPEQLPECDVDEGALNLFLGSGNISLLEVTSELKFKQ
jgi:hypothetical protein